MTQPAVINLHPNKYSQEFNHYPFGIKLDRCVGSCNTLNKIYNKVCIPNKPEDLHLSINSAHWWNNDKCRCECKKRHVCEKNPARFGCEHGKYLASIMEDSTITCNEIIESYDEETKTIPTNFNEKKPKFLYFTCIFINYYSVIDSC